MKGGTLPKLIDRFVYPWSFLSNFEAVPVKLWIWEGVPYAKELIIVDSVPNVVIVEEYDSVEHAYQAAKFLDAEIRARFRYNGLLPGQAKRLGAALNKKKRGDWTTVSLVIMRDLLAQKFKYSILKRKLLSTFSATLIEGNTWHDNFWGNCTCEKCSDEPGLNWLGVLLMSLRNEIAGI